MSSKWSPSGPEQAVACPDPRLSYLSVGDEYFRTATRGYKILMAELGQGATWCRHLGIQFVSSSLVLGVGVGLSSAEGKSILGAAGWLSQLWVCLRVQI